jgi:hypothetical protein
MNQKPKFDLDFHKALSETEAIIKGEACDQIRYKYACFRNQLLTVRESVIQSLDTLIDIVEDEMNQVDIEIQSE